MASKCTPTNLNILGTKFFSLNYRFMSRCLLLEFGLPCLDISLSEYVKLPDLLENASSNVGFLIGLGKKFVEQGIQEMDEDILPELRRMAGQHLLPRVLPSYAIPMWFTLQVTMANYTQSCL